MATAHSFLEINKNKRFFNTFYLTNNYQLVQHKNDHHALHHK